MYLFYLTFLYVFNDVFILINGSFSIFSRKLDRWRKKWDRIVRKIRPPLENKDRNQNFKTLKVLILGPGVLKYNRPQVAPLHSSSLWPSWNWQKTKNFKKK